MKIRDVNVVKEIIKTIDLTQLPTTNIFSKAVLDVYREALVNPDMFILHSDTTMSTPIHEDVTIWIANDISNRRFHSHGNQELTKKLNSKLTHYDTLLLDQIYKSIKDRTDLLTKRLAL